MATPNPMSSIPPRRCSRHNLAAAPDGQCIVCRRESGAIVSEVISEPSTNLWPWLIGVVVLLGGGGAAAWSAMGSHQAPPPLPAAVAARPIERQVEAPKAEKTDAEILAESLRKLEQAEQQRLADERAGAAREQEERTAADVKRKREEALRDQKRHEDVKRELEALGKSTARRDVRITMYSTSWCGVCKRARAYMESKHIGFTELDVDNDAAARTKALALNPRGSVPTFAVDDEVLIGFDPASLEAHIERAVKRRTGS